MPTFWNATLKACRLEASPMLAKTSETSATNQVIIELTSQFQATPPPSLIDETVEIEGLLDPSGASLVYAGYPYNPYA
jgi:hypothetical protein